MSYLSNEITKEEYKNKVYDAIEEAVKNQRKYLQNIGFANKDRKIIISSALIIAKAALAAANPHVFSITDSHVVPIKKSRKQTNTF